jgi:peptidoglycan/xylan/chitin deacetylase (PgdA/CDA1 family)
MSRTQDLMKTLAVSFLDMSGAVRLMRPFYAGRGAILAFHRVLPAGAPVLEAGNVVRTGHLREILQYVVGNGYEIISLDEVPERLRRRPDGSGRFIAITLDDGYRDNLLHALPIFREFKAPFTVFPTTGFVSRTSLYWPALMGALLSHSGRIELKNPDGRVSEYACATPDEKNTLSSRLRQSGWDQSALEQSLAGACVARGLSPARILDETFLSWEELGSLAGCPLVTIGVHTVSHASLAGLPEDRALWEISAARDELRARLGVTVRHVAYPYGSGGACGDREFRLAREMGFLTGVTTHRGNLHGRHQFSLWSLPRHTISMARHSANVRYLRISLDGVWDSPLNGTLVHR